MGWLGRDGSADVHDHEAPRAPAWLRAAAVCPRPVRHFVALEEHVSRCRHRRRAGLSNRASDGLSSLAGSTDKADRLGDALGGHRTGPRTDAATPPCLRAPAGGCRAREWRQWRTLREFPWGPSVAALHGTLYDGPRTFRGRCTGARSALSETPAVLWPAHRTQGSPSRRYHVVPVGGTTLGSRC